MDESVRSKEHLQELYNCWRRNVRDKVKASRKTGASGESKITSADEKMYDLLKKRHKNLVGGYKVPKIVFMIIPHHLYLCADPMGGYWRRTRRKFFV